jgi:hypothetical protein
VAVRGPGPASPWQPAGTLLPEPCRVIISAVPPGCEQGAVEVAAGSRQQAASGEQLAAAMSSEQMAVTCERWRGAVSLEQQRAGAGSSQQRLTAGAAGQLVVLG